MSNVVLSNAYKNTPRKQFPATETLSPGHVVETTDDSGTRSVQKNATAAQYPDRLVLALPLKIDGIDGEYADGDSVRVAYLKSGDEAYAMVWGRDLDASSDSAISKEDLLVKTSDGRLALDSTADPTAKALEGVDSGASKLAKIEVL